MPRPIKEFHSHGDGAWTKDALGGSGDNLVVEDGVRIFDPQNVWLGDNVYIGHDAHLVGYHNGHLRIGANSWIGPGCYLHGAGGIDIGERVGIGARVSILTSTHTEEGRQTPILYSALAFAPVRVEDDCDIGVGAILLPGVHIGRGCQIGAGAVVTQDLPAYCVAAGVPARILRSRPET